MTRVKLGGRELVIDDSELAAYLKLGYAVIDGKGNELSKCIAATYEQAVADNKTLLAENKRLITDLEGFRTENIAYKAELQRLKKDLAAAREEIETLKKQPTHAQPTVEAGKASNNTLEASKQAKANKSSSGKKSPENEEFGLKTAT